MYKISQGNANHETLGADGDDDDEDQNYDDDGGGKGFPGTLSSCSKKLGRASFVAPLGRIQELLMMMMMMMVVMVLMMMMVLVMSLLVIQEIPMKFCHDDDVMLMIVVLMMMHSTAPTTVHVEKSKYCILCSNASRKGVLVGHDI